MLIYPRNLSTAACANFSHLAQLSACAGKVKMPSAKAVRCLERLNLLHPNLEVFVATSPSTLEETSAMAQIRLRLQHTS